MPKVSQLKLQPTLGKKLFRPSIVQQTLNVIFNNTNKIPNRSRLAHSHKASV